MTKDIFKKQTEIKPYTYPHLLEYMKAIRGTMWFIDEFKERLDRDVNDFNFNMTTNEKTTVKRALLAISQIETSVKTFWGNIYDKMPKPEIGMVGYSLAHSEVIHQEAYSELLTMLGLEKEFKVALEEPVIKGRVDYLTKYLKGASENKKENYTLNLLLFSAFIESCSLFSQFYIIKSYCQNKQLLKTVDNIIMATAKEEDVHFQFGMELINIIKKENPEWFNEEFINKIKRACLKAYKAEKNIINWIFNNKDLDFITMSEVDNFVKDRFNKALSHLNIEPLFDIHEGDSFKEWFEEERVLDSRGDFFDIQITNYTIGQQDISADTIF